mmetsp:Transcript_34499/g.50658  ORF Transcript_34499/g.50658 Transcript_34499/m.50658 type:complete len:95 (-) Transcript_34499:15-299(-)
MSVVGIMSAFLARYVCFIARDGGCDCDCDCIIQNAEQIEQEDNQLGGKIRKMVNIITWRGNNLCDERNPRFLMVNLLMQLPPLLETISNCYAVL